MDVSGSMGDQQKEIVRIASFWIDTWLRSQYSSLDNVYVVHEAFAKEVDQHTFYHLRESGGTRISTAYELINQVIDTRFPPESWNVYLFHFSDGENGDSRDTDRCMELLRDDLLPKLNLFCFGQVRSSYGGGRFKTDLEEALPRRAERSSPARSATRTRSTTPSRGSWARGCEPLPRDSSGAARRSRRYAREYGLDFYDVVFEMLDYDQLNEVAAYGGFPTRYPHWRFGMEYEELSKSYSYGLSKIYELVINNNPVYAYLMKANAPVEQKLVMAHVFGHADFFKNNLWFSKTNRRMIDAMANHATRVRQHIDRHGVEAVEDFIDACLSLENLIDYHAHFIERQEKRDRGAHGPEPEEEDAPAVPRLQEQGLHGALHQPARLPRGAEGQAWRSAPSASGRCPRSRSATCCSSCSSTRRSRTGSATSSHRARGGLLLRAAGHDQDTERGLGRLSGTARS